MKNAAFDIRDFGARENIAPAANRAAINRAIQAASAAGGGRVVVPPGEWRTGTVELRSGVELHLQKGAVLKGSDRQADYNADDAFPENFHSVGEEWSGGHLILAYKVENVAITGEGVIDGSGCSFFGETQEEGWFPGYKYGIKLHPTDREWFRPGPMVAFFLSRGIRLEGVTLRNTPCWTAHFRCCEGLVVRGGVKGATPYDPDGVKQADRRPLVTNDAVFLPASDLPNRFRIDTILVGEAYHTDIDEIRACLRRAAERKEVLSITSHDIAPDAKHIHMKTEWLSSRRRRSAALPSSASTSCPERRVRLSGGGGKEFRRHPIISGGIRYYIWKRDNCPAVPWTS